MCSSAVGSIAAAAAITDCGSLVMRSVSPIGPGCISNSVMTVPSIAVIKSLAITPTIDAAPSGVTAEILLLEPSTTTPSGSPRVNWSGTASIATGSMNSECAFYNGRHLIAL